MEDRMDEVINKMEQMNLEIERLKQENSGYRKELDVLNKTVHEMYQINNEIVMHISKIIGDMTTLDLNQNITKVRCDNLRYELLDPLLDRSNYYFPVIQSQEETLREIIENGKSIARFGDGEFSVIAKIKRHKFQKPDDKLAVRLNEVLHSSLPNLLLAVADNYGALDKYTGHAADGIRFYMAGGDSREQHMRLLEHDRVYYDAYVTRPYVMYKDSGTDAPKIRFERWKKVWNGRNVFVVEGAQTRIGIGNDLLANAASVKRILAPPTNSFDRYEDILSGVLRHAKEGDLFLIALGPSGGVLAYDLTSAGYQALDIGHLDLEYEWFLAGKGERVKVPCKYNNEVAGDDSAEDIHDPAYESQIIERYDSI